MILQARHDLPVTGGVPVTTFIMEKKTNPNKQTGNFIKKANVQADFNGLFIKVPRQTLHCPVKGRGTALKQKLLQMISKDLNTGGKNEDNGGSGKKKYIQSS